MTNWKKARKNLFDTLKKSPNLAMDIIDSAYLAGIEATKKEVLVKQKKELIDEELEILKRLQLDFNVIECDCGEEWKGSDPHVVVNERIDKLDSLIN